MIKIATLDEAMALLAKYIPLAQSMTGKNITLERMRPLMAALGSPEKSLKIIHVAGTSGKTSTSYYIAALLTAAGIKVGMTVSPHIDSITERVQINMLPISDSEFCDALAECIERITAKNIQPTYFELLVGLAYWYFAKIGVAYVVVETGLGGMQDSTNIAERPDKVCVITDIGYDHMHVLGNTLSEIAAQKAGIIHEYNQVYMYTQSSEVMQRIHEQCEKVGATVRELKPDTQKVLNLPDFQERNFKLAYEVYASLGLMKLSKAKLQEVANTYIPARMDSVVIGTKTVIMDGAHNQQKMLALVTALKSQFPNKKFTVLIGLKAGKEHQEVLPLLRDITNELITTQCMPHTQTLLSSISPKELADTAKKHGFEKVMNVEDNSRAYEIAMQSESERILITGSFYLIGQLRSVYPELIH